MDQRDRPRISSALGQGPRDLGNGDIEVEIEADATERPGGVPRFRRLAQLVPPQKGGKRLSPQRLILGGAAALAVVVLAWVLGSKAVRETIAYLHHQPAYRVSYRDIVLEPAPPPGYRGGAVAFLDRVWTASNEPREFSALELDGARVTALFRRYPWVESVSRVERTYPARVVVHLSYRTPVAEGNAADGSKLLIDREGVLLPFDDWKHEAANGLVTLHGFPAPPELRYGEVWSKAEAKTGVAEANEQILIAAPLAAAVASRLGELKVASGSPRVYIYLFKGGIYVQLSWGTVPETLRDLMVFWENDPRSDPSTRRLDFDRKWDMLREWLRQNPPEAPAAKRTIHLYFNGQTIDIDPRTGGESGARLNDRRTGSPTRR